MNRQFYRDNDTKNYYEKFSLFYFDFPVAYLCTSCSKEDNDPKNELNIESDKIICEMCDDFGVVLEANKNQLFVGGNKRVWIFDYSPQEIN